MTIEQLRRKAVWMGNIRISVSNPYINEAYKTTFHEITHYFDEDMNEIGQFAIWNTKPLMFDPPRCWAQEFLHPNNLTLIKIHP